MAFKIRQGPTADRQAFVPAQGELIYDTVTKEVYVGDGSTLGGVSVSGGALSSETVQDLSAALLTSGTHSGITFTYDDNLAKLNAVVNFPVQAVNYSFNVTGVDSTLRSINNGETVQFLGSGGIDVIVDTEGRVTIDGSNITGTGGGSGDLSNVHFFVASTDSTVAQINNNETVKFVGAGSVTVTVDSEGQLTFTGTSTGSIGNSFTGNSIPYYDGAGTTLASASTSLSYNPGTQTLYADRLQTARIETDIIRPFNTSGPGTGINIFPGSYPYVTLGGTLDGTDYPGRLRTIDTGGFFAYGTFKMAEFMSIHNDVATNSLDFTRFRGTVSTPLSVQANDSIGSITWSGFSGVQGVFAAPGAAIYATVADTPTFGSFICPAHLFVQTSNTDGVLKDAIFINENQDVRIIEKLIIDDHIEIEGNLIRTIISNSDLELRANGTGQVHIHDDASVYGDLTIDGGGVLYATSIDTSDSSALEIVPATTFMSDVTVENSLNVTNKIYAKEFVSTSTGVPSIVSDNSLNIDIGTKEFAFQLDGGFKLPVLSAAPSSPVVGALYVADSVGWDPAAKVGSIPYPVFYDGSSYNALY